MAAHIRQQIREALKAALLGLPATGARVYTNRAAKLESRLGADALVIYTPTEAAEPINLRLTVYRRSLDIAVEGYVFGPAPDERLDALALALEPALAAAGTLGGLLKAPLELVRSALDVDETASPPAGRLTLTLSAITHTTLAAPDVVA